MTASSIASDVPSNLHGDSSPLPTVEFDPDATGVLFLGDDGGFNNDALRDAIEGDGFTVQDATPFYTWNGAGLVEARVAVYHNPLNYDRPLTRAGNSALTSWMMSGGTVIRAEWTAYWLGSNPARGIDRYLPALSPDASFHYDTVWTVTDALHPLTAGLPASWSSGGGGTTEVVLQSGATAVAQTNLSGPAIAFKSFGDGRVIYINSDFGNDAEIAPDVNILRALRNAVAWGAP